MQLRQRQSEFLAWNVLSRAYSMTGRTISDPALGCDSGALKKRCLISAKRSVNGVAGDPQSA
jgi:hypothetical protein